MLIVNDAPVESALLARLLRDLGHETIALVPDLPTALARCKELVLDLAIVDGRLPPGGGLDALEALREASPATRVAIVASLGEIELVRSAMARGAAGALRRPLLRSQVETALRDLA